MIAVEQIVLVQEVKVIRHHPGDLLVVRLAARPSQAMAHKVQEVVQERAPEARVLVTGPDADVEIRAMQGRPHQQVTDLPEPSYFTVQMSDNAPGGRHLIHLGLAISTGNGNNVCGLDRHAKDARGRGLYGFSCSGGASDPDATACPSCVTFLASRPGPIRGTFRDLFSTDDVRRQMQEYLR